MEKLLEKEECSKPGLSKLELLVLKTRFQETQEDSPFQVLNVLKNKHG